MDAILERYAAASIRVSESGIREGAILAVEHAGRAWRDQLADLARGWRG
jgi:exopolyphosphatase/pppGpp-phosphohydrolase